MNDPKSGLCIFAKFHKGIRETVGTEMMVPLNKQVAKDTSEVETKA